jgi:TPP-dependent pyruvate/acetoin dehydrogenase alpha subunit
MHLRLYRALYRIRRVEEEIARVYPTDCVKSPVHLSIGQEAVSVGVCEALEERDVVFGTYRGHALYLARGGDLRAMIAELYGKVTGCARGKGGSMHLIDVERGVMGMSAVVGTTIANAVGYAQALRYRKSEAIVASFFGDGATEEGVFAESMNYAVLKQLPILFVCENNRYAIHTHQRKRQGSMDLCGKARAFGMPAERIDGNNVLRLIERARQHVRGIRAGEGPRFLEVMTYRWREHVGPGEDYQLGFRSPEEAEEWKRRDALKQVVEMVGEKAREQIREEVEAEIARAFAFAEMSPFPGADELMRDVYAEAQHAGT